MPELVSIINPNIDETGEELYKTSDKKICCTLAALKHKLVKVEYEQGGRSRRAIYVFRKKDIEKHLAMLVSGEELPVNAHALWAAWDNFKTALNA